MIRREVAEALWPEFVAKLDTDLEEATQFCRSQAKYLVWPKKPKPTILSPSLRSERGVVPSKVLDVLTYSEELSLKELVEETECSYNTVKGAIATLVKDGTVIRIERGLYILATKRGTLAGEN